MPIQYESIVPWGRSYQEYCQMFMLQDNDLNSRIIGCGDGPASFNAEMTQIGKKVTSIDPLYQFSKEEIEERLTATYQTVLKQTENNRDKFRWTTIPDIPALGNIRQSAMQTFLSDYEMGKMEERYICGELPFLAFPDKSFDLALSSHFLFLYSEHLSLQFHIEAISEMLRVAGEARIFPLLDLNAGQSPYLEEVKSYFLDKGFNVLQVTVPYEFQIGGNQMLQIRY